MVRQSNESGTKLAHRTVTSNFPSFDEAESKSVDSTGCGGNRLKCTGGRLYLSGDPGQDVSVWCRLSFYATSAKTEDVLLWATKFNLTYTETNGGASAEGTTDVVDDVGGLVNGDLVRYMGGTSENVRLTAAPDADTNTLAFTALANDHADNTAVVRVVELPDFSLTDDDGTSEIHATLEMLSDPGDSVSVELSMDVLPIE